MGTKVISAKSTFLSILVENNRKLSEAENFQFIPKNTLKMSFPYHEFKIYTRVYKPNSNGVMIGERQLWDRAA